MKVIYIAGPFRADSAWDRQQQIMRAMTVALDLWRAGCAVICPHANTMFFQDAAPDQVWLEGDLELMRRSDAVLLLPDWPVSRGAIAEKWEAERMGLPVFEEMAECLHWVHEAA